MEFLQNIMRITEISEYFHNEFPEKIIKLRNLGFEF